jgi:hypothetical protein
LTIYDEGKFISMELGKYWKEVGIEKECLLMSSCSNSCGDERLFYLVTWSPSIAKDRKVQEEV